MNNKEIIRKLICLLTNYKKKIFFIIVCLLITIILNLYIPIISKHIMDDGFINHNQKTLIKLVMLSLLIYIISMIITIIKEKIRINIASRIQYSLAEKSFSHLMNLQINYFNDKNHAEILNNLNIDINNIASIADESVFFVITQIFNIIGGIIGLFIINYQMTILVLFFIPLRYIIMRYFAKKQKTFMDEFISASEIYAQWFGNTLAGIKEIKLFTLFQQKHLEFKDKQMKLINKQKQMNLLSQWNSLVNNIMLQLLSSSLYILGANLVFNMQLSIGSIFAFITYSSYVTGPISSILNIGYLLSSIIPSAKRYYEFMDLKEEYDFEENILFCFDDIYFKNVSFSYNSSKEILHDINITFPKASKNALIGKNGSGKTTIINLLTRLYIPSNGTIFLGNQEILSIPLVKYRDMFSIVSQQVYLFNDTIRNNISLYKQIDDNILIDICKDCGLNDIINKFSLDYIVGENGSMLSGGQKQKLALARAIIHDKPIVIFDEATSNADVYSEHQINSLLDTRLKDKTVIIITHKKEILDKVDQILFLKDGFITVLNTKVNYIK